jgi:hypothetical protein
MRKMLTITLLLSSTPAMACHHYSVWNYPYKQTCKNNSMEAKFVPPREIQKSPLQKIMDAPLVPPSTLYAMEDIQQLNVLLRTKSEYEDHIPDIPVDVMFKTDPSNLKPVEDMENKIGEDEIQRMNAIEKLKQQQQ